MPYQVMVESLEARQMFAASFTLNDVSFSTTNGAAHVTAPGFNFAWWTDTSAFDTANGFDDSKANIAKIARIAERGGNAPWSGKVIPPRTATILDFGADGGHDLAFYTQRLRWFHEYAPHTKVAMIGVQWGVLKFIREQVAYPTAEDQTAIDQAVSEGKDFVAQMDFLPLYAYMLGPAGLDRDLKFIENGAADFKKAFPGKPIVTWTWGVYHPSWNPSQSLLSDTDTRRLVQTCIDNTSGIITWGAQEDNVKLTSMAVQMTSGIQTRSVSTRLSTRQPVRSIFSPEGAIPALFSTDPILA